MSFLFSTPEPPKVEPLPEPPEVDTEEVKRRYAKSGHIGNIFTSPLGVTGENKKTLLGE
jgi:hypothetical protein